MGINRLDRHVVLKGMNLRAVVQDVTVRGGHHNAAVITEHHWIADRHSHGSLVVIGMADKTVDILQLAFGGDGIGFLIQTRMTLCTTSVHGYAVHIGQFTGPVDIGLDAEVIDTPEFARLPGIQTDGFSCVALPLVMHGFVSLQSLSAMAFETGFAPFKGRKASHVGAVHRCILDVPFHPLIYHLCCQPAGHSMVCPEGTQRLETLREKGISLLMILVVFGRYFACYTSFHPGMAYFLRSLLVTQSHPCGAGSWFHNFGVNRRDSLFPPWGAGRPIP